MSNLAHTRAFQALLACHTRLTGLTFPSSPKTNRTPQVRFMANSDVPDMEYVDLLGKVEDSEATFVASRGSIEEQFELLIRCGTVIPGVEGPAVIERLGQIVSVVEGAFRSTSTGEPIPLDFPDGDGQHLVKGGIMRIEIDSFPNTDRGWAAIADLYLRVYARR